MTGKPAVGELSWYKKSIRKMNNSQHRPLTQRSGSQVHLSMEIPTSSGAKSFLIPGTKTKLSLAVTPCAFYLEHQVRSFWQQAYWQLLGICRQDQVCRLCR